eukprot:TRINITY_DN1825_c0_g1_i1.p1 TRINITY_DN1825_c0_g1~~TRINITY_DN1825_c0_g1_i1.p1  ORF type:complete len:316 (-),score=68.35 TRINITY_DN1825_c0_g1_i1:74-1021(-)
MAQRRKLKFALEGPREIRSGTTAQYVLVVTDQDDNKVQLPGNPFKILFSGNGEETYPKVKDNAMGGWEFEVLPYRVGPYIIEVSKGEQVIFRESLNAISKTSAQTSGLLTKTKINMKGYGLMGGATGDEASFNLSAVDAMDGKPVPILDTDLKVTIKGVTGDAEGEYIPVKLKGSGPEWTAYFKPVKPGAYEVEVLLRGNPVLRRPHRINFASQIDATQSLIALPITTCRAGTPVQFKIIAKDKTGYRLGLGGHTFSIKVTGPEGQFAQPTIADMGNGTYSCSVVLSAPDDVYEISAFLDGEPLGNSPVTVKTTN